MKTASPLLNALIPEQLLKDIPAEAFPIVVSGDSMEPTIYDGDICYCREVKRTRKVIPEGFLDGDLVLAKFDSEAWPGRRLGYLIKRLQDSCLVSDNKKYLDWDLTNGVFSIVGNVVKVIRKENCIIIDILASDN
jgi:phage repressor protein C with HTH and peptisase S24 domain